MYRLWAPISGTSGAHWPRCVPSRSNMLMLPTPRYCVSSARVPFFRGLDDQRVRGPVVHVPCIHIHDPVVIDGHPGAHLKHHVGRILRPALVQAIRRPLCAHGVGGCRTKKPGETYPQTDNRHEHRRPQPRSVMKHDALSPSCRLVSDHGPAIFAARSVWLPSQRLARHASCGRCHGSPRGTLPLPLAHQGRTMRSGRIRPATAQPLRRQVTALDVHCTRRI